MQQDIPKLLLPEETETFSSDSAYEQTLLDGKRAFQCLHPSCEKVTRYKSDMERHIIIHQKDKPYACKHPGCGRNFKRPDALKNHIQAHSEATVFYCDIPGCDAQFSKKPALHYHLRQHKNQRFCCTFPGCQKSFKTSKHLKQHEKAIQYHERLAKSSSSQNSSQKDIDDLDCYFNHSETQNSHEDDEEDFFSQPEKFLHTEQKAVCPRFNNASDLTEIPSEVQFPDWQKPSQLAFQEMLNRLMKENQEMKVKLARQMGSLKENYGIAGTQESLNPQFNFINDF